MDRIGHYLADVCREVREQAKANRSLIAAQFNASEWTVRRFELQQGKWSAQTDELVAAYAHMAGVEPSDIWQRAIDRWRQAQAEASPEGVAGLDTTESERSLGNLGQSTEKRSEGNRRK